MCRQRSIIHAIIEHIVFLKEVETLGLCINTMCTLIFILKLMESNEAKTINKYKNEATMVEPLQDLKLAPLTKSISSATTPARRDIRPNALAAISNKRWKGQGSSSYCRNQPIKANKSSSRQR